MGKQPDLKTQDRTDVIQDEKSIKKIADDNFNIMMSKLKEAREKTRFISPGPEELTLAGQLFMGLFQGKSPAALEPELNRLDLILEKIQVSGKDYHIIMEPSTHRSGRGFYIFPAIMPKSPLASQVLMIPHGLYDYHTGDIGIHLMLEGSFAGGAFNTVHRYGSKKSKGGSSSENWDMADLFDTYFSAFAKAFVKTSPSGHLIQLHGFSREKRETSEGRDSDIIISSGTSYPSTALELLGDCMKINLPGMTRLYPMEVNDLGGTQNTIGKIMRSMDHTGFIHIEISLSMREKIAYNNEIRRPFLTCLEKLLTLK